MTRKWACFLTSFALVLSQTHYLCAEDPKGTGRTSVAPTVLNTEPTALDRYIKKEDPAYQWKLVTKKRDIGSTVYVLELTSQSWRTEKDVDRTEWKHWVTIVKPDGATSNTAMLFISGGGVGGEPPKSAAQELVLVAGTTQAVIAELKMVPSQPLVFHEDGERRVEDNLIGYTWDQFLRTGDDTWPAQLPMTKSAVRAMDAVQEFLATDEAENYKVEKFVVSGASKRGWTTWLTGAMDDRVVAIAPIVIDVLNVNISMQHHYSAYGFWAPAIGDYVRHDITARRFYPRYQELMQIVDPFAYRDRLDMPKCIINATGDQFFLPDSSRFYFDQLPGEKHLCYVPNADHSLRGSNAVETLASFLYCIVNDIERPNLNWEFPDSNSIRATSSTKPTEVLMWSAENKDARDFRVDTIGKAYKSTPLKPDSDGSYSATMEQPAEGWTAFFLEFTFDVGAPTPIRFTTPVRVVPDELPFEDKQAPVLKEN